MTPHLLNVYNRAYPLFERGEGSWLFTPEGDAYLDCVGGIATNALGHAHPALVAALTGQAQKLWHISNMSRVEGQERLAGALTAASFADRVFFANSGTEAIECALKMARRYHFVRGAPERTMIYGFAGAFHGRSYAAINAAGNPAYVEGFGDRLPGYATLDLGDVKAIANAIATPTTAAIIVEPVQGEGGARDVPRALLRLIRGLCRRHGVLLIYDEVQAGMGRTGRLFAHQWHRGIEPDIMAVAKALGCGFPVGACLATEDAASGMAPGTHGSTFGGNPLAMAVANVAFDIIAAPETLTHVLDVAQLLRGGFESLRRNYPSIIRDIRGRGLLIGVALHPNNRAFVTAARDQKLLLAAGGDNIVRLLPALNISTADAGEALRRFEASCIAMQMEAAA